MTAHEATVRACIAAAVVDGLVDSNRVRELLAAHPEVPPNAVGPVYRRLRNDGTLVEVDRVRSTDTRGGNAGKWMPLYRVERDVAAITAPAAPTVMPSRRKASAPRRAPGSSALGPCASCGITHERYGDHGRTLCDWCAA